MNSRATDAKFAKGGLTLSAQLARASYTVAGGFIPTLYR